MKRSGFLKSLFFGTIAITGLPTFAESVIGEQKTKDHVGKRQPMFMAKVGMRGVGKTMYRHPPKLSHRKIICIDIM